MKRYVSWMVLVVLVGVVGLLFYRNVEKGSAMQEESAENFQIRVPLVQVIEVESGDALEVRKFTGVAKEGKTIKQSFRVPGPLVAFDVEIGKRVAKGDILGKIDPRDYELKVQQVAAGLEEANSALSMMKTGARAEDIAALEANLAATEAQFETADKNERRYAELLESGSASQAQYDQIKMVRDSAKAARDAAQKQLEKGKAGARAEEIQAMEAKIAGLKVQQQQAKNALEDTILRAPSDGYVSQKYVENGEIVAPGIPVLAFTDVSQMEVEVSIPEALLIRQNDFETYTCEFEIYPGELFPAQLKEIGQALQSGKQGYPLDVVVTDSKGKLLHPGMAASLRIGLKRLKIPLAVPLAALVGGEAEGGKTQSEAGTRKTMVMTVDSENIVRAKPVKVVRVLGERAEIEGDLQAGEKIVGAGARFLKEGQKVRLQ